MKDLIEISAEGKWYTCERVMNDRYPRTREFDNIEQVKNNCPKRISDILERNWVCIDTCEWC